MGKTSRFKYAYRSNASKLHKNVGEILRLHPLLKNFQSYQEYPVNKINPNFPNGKSKIDWVILDLRVCIEIQGQQHFSYIPFFHKTHDDFLAGQKRDKEKKDAIEAAGYTYIAVKYDSELDVDKLIDIAIANSIPVKAPSKPVKAIKQESYRMTSEQKEKAREIRKEQYKRMKEYMKNKN